MFQDLLDLDRNDISAPASGLEDTTKGGDGRSGDKAFSIGDDEKKTDLREVLIKKREVSTLDQVVDPASGKIYASPSDARKAGITNWVFKHEQDEDQP
jgi:hypothetical protein